MKLLLLPHAAFALAGCVSYGDQYPAYSGTQPYYNSQPYSSGIYYSTPGVYYGTPGTYYGTDRGSRDRDRDGIPNRVDRDRDGDGVPNRDDARPNNPRRY